MTQDYPDPLKLDPVGVSKDGQRHFYDEQAKQRVILACLQPGASLAGVALRAGVNANLLRRWVKRHQEKHEAAAAELIEHVPATFVPVVGVRRTDMPAGQPEPLPARREPSRVPPRCTAPTRLTVEMPNGITLKLDCSEQDAPLVSAMIETLGRCDVPARR
ncbi:MAG: transposase [Paraburkholderia sp.]|jgi:transposase|uniref:IS66-like element accessory protein TnpA n=1 Tax=Paraburkholderia sp. TaxID=1926495 RepID=UPI00397DE8B4